MASSEVDAMPLQRHFNLRCDTVLNKPNTPLPEKIEQVQAELDSIHANLLALIQAKERHALLLEEEKEPKRHAEALLRAIEQNAEKNVGQLYAGDLIKNNQASFDALIAKASAKDMSEWHNRLEKLNSRDLTNSLLYAASTAAFLPIALYRLVLSKATRENLESFVPDTFDSESKGQLKALATDTITQLDAKLNRSNDEIKFITAKLAGANTAENILLAAANPVDLGKLLEPNRTAYRAMTSCAEFVNKIDTNQKLLATIASKEAAAGTYVKKHYDIFVKISLFLSEKLGSFFKSEKIASFFKTDKAASVEKKLTKLSNLKEAKAIYEEDLHKIMQDLESHPGIAIEHKDLVKHQFSAGRSNSPPIATHGLRAALEQLRQSDTEAENTRDNQP